MEALLRLLQKVLQNLLKERVPVRDMVTILETLADHARSLKDTDLLTEFVTISLLVRSYSIWALSRFALA